jgi:recombinational DNA repair protein RecT
LEGGTSSKEIAKVIESKCLERLDTFKTFLMTQDEKVVKRFYTGAMLSLVKNPDLATAAACSPGSFVTACLTAAEEGLNFMSPNEAHLVPIAGKVALFRGYKGIRKIAEEADSKVLLDVFEVRANDTYTRTRGSSASIELIMPPFGQDRGAVIGFAATAMSPSGTKFDEMTVEDIENHARRYIKSFKGPFSKIKDKGRDAENFVPYGLKTVLIRLCFRQLTLSPRVGLKIKQEYEMQNNDSDQGQTSLPVVDLDGVIDGSYEEV